MKISATNIGIIAGAIAVFYLLFRGEKNHEAAMQAEPVSEYGNAWIGEDIFQQVKKT